MRNETAEKLLRYIEKSTTAFHAVENLRIELEKAGFTGLDERDVWDLKPGGRYYVTRNHSSILSFRLPAGRITGFRIIASHSDSPCFKLKTAPEMKGAGECIRLNVERYGGMILHSWLDRPLSVAGRIIADAEDGLKEILVDLDRDLLMIPSLAIHMDPRINKGAELSVQHHLLPLFGQGIPGNAVPGGDGTAGSENRDGAPVLADLAAAAAGVEGDQVLGADLFVYNRMKPVFWGADEEFIASGRLDDLECAYSSFLGFLENAGTDRSDGAVNVHVVFDNEEVGSATAQGADSTFLEEILERISLSGGAGREEYMAQLASSFMLSADNAHAVHPNYVDKADPVNRPVMNGGIVIKHNAAQKYTTDGVSSARVVRLCRENGIPYQHFTNHSDSPGGSTLGNLSQAHVSVRSADIGLAQLAMHSSYESAGARDPEWMRKLAEAFYREG